MAWPPRAGRAVLRVGAATALCIAGVAASAPASADDDWLSAALRPRPAAVEKQSGANEEASRRKGVRPVAPLARPKRSDSVAKRVLPRREPPAAAVAVAIRTGIDIQGTPAAKDAAPSPKPQNSHVGQHFSTPGKGSWTWRIQRAAWTPEDEAAFELFVQRIGDSTCATVHECLTDPQSNPRYQAFNPPGMRFVADCADLPYLLRAYFAWMNELPFSHSAAVAQRIGANGVRIPGNQVVGRFDIIGPGPDPKPTLARIAQLVSSQHFRIPPAASGTFLPDYYPVRITRESIRPGTVIFDPDGHVAVVTKVTPDGRIHYIDAHPDNTLTRGIYGREFTRAAPEMGAGFKRWRPQELRGATATPYGELVGGNIVLKPDSELADWSDEQFFGTGERQHQSRGRVRQVFWSQGKFEIDGETLDYYDYVRIRLAGPGFKYDPIDETRSMVGALCQDLRYRVQAVDAAIQAGIQLRPQPARLPNNIYATDGDWEKYATPSRDARLKTAFEELRDEVERFLVLQQAGSARLAYTGANLRRDLVEVYRRETAACPISYARSDGAPVQLAFEEVRRRLFRLSFDPYHCPERRWGASEAQELRSCPDGPDKRAWYEAEDRLRNQITRTYGEKMGWSLAELQRRDLEIGMNEAPDVDVLALLEGPGQAQVAGGRGKAGRGH